LPVPPSVTSCSSETSSSTTAVSPITTRCVIDHDALAELGGMDVDVEQFRNRLWKNSAMERRSLLPQPMRDAVACRA